MDNARRQTLIGGLLLAGGIVIPARADAAATQKTVADRFAETLSAHDMEGFAALFSDDYINHQKSAAASPLQDVTPKQATLALFKARLAGLPDLKVEIEAQVAGADKVAASFAYSGTNRGTYMGVAPTGRLLRFTSCDIFRVEQDRIVEHWGMGDIAGVLAQLKA